MPSHKHPKPINSTIMHLSMIICKYPALLFPADVHPSLAMPLSPEQTPWGLLRPEALLLWSGHGISPFTPGNFFLLATSQNCVSHLALLDHLVHRALAPIV